MQLGEFNNNGFSNNNQTAILSTYSDRRIDSVNDQAKDHRDSTTSFTSNSNDIQCLVDKQHINIYSERERKKRERVL